MARLVPLLSHLAPPSGVSGLRLDRFSPGFDDAERLGFLDVAPLPSYAAVYPFAPEAVANLAYSFSFRAQRRRATRATYVAPLLREVARWKRVAKASALFSVPAGDALLVWDLRPVARHPLTVLRGLPRALHEACDASTNRPRAGRTRAARRAAPRARRRSARSRRSSRIASSSSDGERHLALAVPLGRFSPEGRALDALLARRALDRTRRHVTESSIPVHNAASDVSVHSARARGRTPLAADDVSPRSESLYFGPLLRESSRRAGHFLNPRPRGRKQKEFRWQRRRQRRRPRRRS